MNPVWLNHAFKDVGVCEIKDGENPRIIQMHSYTTLKATKDEIPWCSSGCCAWFEEVGIESTKSAAAKSWLDWGVKLEKPRIGCVCILKRKDKQVDKATGSSSGFHVGLWLASGPGFVTLIGANQSDSVKESSFKLSSFDVVGYRWPEGIK